MVCLAAICLVAIGFVYRFLPETKGLSVEEAVGVFEQEARGKPPNRTATPHRPPGPSHA
jgi:hypothetical protein